MSTTPRCFDEMTQLPAAQTSLTPAAVNTRRIVTKLTVSNVSASAATITVNLVASGGSATSSNIIIPARTIGVGDTTSLPEVIGHVLEPGDFLSVLASAATALNLRCSGSVITT